MKTMKWLVRREFWEHKGMFYWAPMIVAALMALFIGGAIIYGFASSGMHHVYGSNENATALTHEINKMPPETRAEVALAIASGYMAVSAPLFLMLAAIIFFYCLGAMFDERRDRSILFWKSLPVSDTQTVLSKVVAALCVAPLITMVFATALAVTLMLIMATALTISGANVFGLLLTMPQLYLTPFEILALLPIYILWALPTVGWLMLVSSWARSKVFLWAVGVPLMAVIVIKYVENQFGVGLDVDWIIQNVILRGLGSAIPGIWLAFEHIGNEQLVPMGMHAMDMGSLLAESWKLLGAPAIWLGAAAGAAMISGAIRMRRWRDEG
jgi:ABC-2 type transport system permease protein